MKITIVTGLLAKWNVEVDHGVLLGSKGKEFEFKYPDGCLGIRGEEGCGEGMLKVVGGY